MEARTKSEIFCNSFSCWGCPFDKNPGCCLSIIDDRDVFRLAIKSDRFNEYRQRARNMNVEFVGKVVLR